MFKIFNREPALWVSAISAALSLAVTLGVGLSADQAGGWTAVISAVFGVVTAVLTRPIAPAAFTTAVAVTADLLSAYHLNVSSGAVVAVNTTVLAILGLLTRGQVSPAAMLTRPKPVAPKSA